MAKAIASVHVFYTLDRHNNEKLLYFPSSQGWAPLMCVNAHNLENFRKIAHEYARAQDCQAVLKRFEMGTIETVLDPLEAQGKETRP